MIIYYQTFIFDKFGWQLQTSPEIPRADTLRHDAPTEKRLLPATAMRCATPRNRCVVKTNGDNVFPGLPKLLSFIKK
jgi:hypothetical protein